MRTTTTIITVLTWILLSVASHGQGTNSRIERIDEISGDLTESELVLAAYDAGVAIQTGTLARFSSTGFLGAGLRTAEAARFSLNDLAAGLEFNFSFFRNDRVGLKGDFYIRHVTLDDPISPARITAELLDLSGNLVAIGEGTFDLVGELPPPEQDIECTETTSPGVNEHGEECINYVNICVSDDPTQDVGIVQVCLIINQI